MRDPTTPPATSPTTSPTTLTGPAPDLLADSPPSPPCRRTAAGHEPHWIQARLAWREEPAHLLLADFRVYADGVFTLVDRHGGGLTLFNHDPRRIHGLLDESLREQPEQPLRVVEPAVVAVRATAGPGWAIVSAVPLEQATHCHQPDAQDALEEAVRSHGEDPAPWAELEATDLSDPDALEDLQGHPALRGLAAALASSRHPRRRHLAPRDFALDPDRKEPR